MKTNICDLASSLFESLCCCFNTVVYFHGPNKNSTDSALNGDNSIQLSLDSRASSAVVEYLGLWKSNTIKMTNIHEYFRENIGFCMNSDFNMLKAPSASSS